jgi:hypothetical protein
MEKWIHLHPDDNVLIARVTIEVGEELMIGGDCVKVLAKVELGNKLALRNIEAGAPILKYGLPIGTALVFIPTGALVHVHNIKSNYITQSC